MATGLTIRDFFKAYREATYSEQGSFVLSDVEKNAYRNSLTLEVIAYDAERANNYKTLPENTHWGYATHFRGSTVTLNQPVKFVKYRLFDLLNPDIWQYHQHTESVDFITSLVVEAASATALKLLDEGVPFPGFEKLIELNENLEDSQNPILKWLIGVQEFADPQVPASLDSYTAYPVGHPFPDTVKFKSDIPASFKFRLESWYLVNPVVYIVASPVDGGDVTEGEDEYPKPEQGDGDGDGSEFPPSSLPDPNADPRDYDEDLAGGSGVWNIQVEFSNPGNNGFCDNIPNATIQLRGFPDEFPKREFTGPANPATGGRPGRFYTSVASAAHSGDCALSIVGIPTFFSDNEPT